MHIGEHDAILVAIDRAGVEQRSAVHGHGIGGAIHRTRHPQGAAGVDGEGALREARRVDREQPAVHGHLAREAAVVARQRSDTRLRPDRAGAGHGDAEAVIAVGVVEHQRSGAVAEGHAAGVQRTRRCRRITDRRADVDRSGRARELGDLNDTRATAHRYDATAGCRQGSLAAGVVAHRDCPVRADRATIRDGQGADVVPSDVDIAGRQRRPGSADGPMSVARRRIAKIDLAGTGGGNGATVQNVEIAGADIADIDAVCRQFGAAARHIQRAGTSI